MAEQVGVRETARAPSVSAEEFAITTGREVTVAEASRLLGVPVRVPPAPEGFTLVDSRYLDAALSAESGGTYALFYAGLDAASVMVYQERAAAASFAALAGSAIRVALEDGTTATYVKGAWEPSGDGLAWNEESGQSLIFERGGLRTTLQYTGPEAAAPSLFALAESMTPG
jgi:hypothetical protein